MPKSVLLSNLHDLGKEDSLIPATKFNGVAEQVLMLLWKSGQPNEMDLKRFEKEAAAIRNTEDVAGGWEIAALVAAARRKPESVRAAWKNGRMAPGHDVLTPFRFAECFAFVGEESTAVDVMRRAVEAVPKNATLAERAGGVLMTCGYVREAALMHLKAAELRGADVPENLASLVDDLEGFDAEEVAAPIIFARHFLRERWLSPIPGSAWITTRDDGEQKALVYRIGLNIGAERCAEVESELFAALAEADLPLERDGLLILTIAPSALPGYGDLDAN